ncbi:MULTISPECIES: sensor histidine kinase [unclassified Paenibacillus]|uniref:sensor histidine kinase n=1 Tax=unclassified Paenibacillus TaxID=185978 RepID=UPI002404D3DF|nr:MULTISPECIES: sensor histidine kinase [unclassified Paenibacillus]MDF9843743.1 signal transduction histidine kinase [Paenibacillus sp. PastF-2]MDF9850418.1 signal transduction histidine kinase [Paenibacillus sp. PastM-2]MDF9856879.1 signal transduction histidine kinase [Paenibacillus sp. PastF-1]MDH6482264.1 signal transduction histidine kinase [Paenibacillus sp. PastH-2]MDH6509572.1 signal transduction histidine kinase [Paenibacillus sp. PastM-3]
MAEFKPMARIISHFGERLISSTQVALLELIKNSYDAKSPIVNITIDQKERKIIIYDEGDGMDGDVIENCWLVVGTANRLDDKEELEEGDVDVPLGEKGLGRFSTMKLGNHLKLETTTLDSKCIWNLEIDWSKYGYKSRLFLDEVENKFYKTQKKEYERKYTRITITDIKDFIGDEWTIKAINDFLLDSASKFINPYKALPRKFTVTVELIDHNGDKKKWILGKADSELFSQAHYEAKGTYVPGNLEMEYWVRNQGEIIEHLTVNIPLQRSLINDDKELEGYVGSFDYHFYIFNRTGSRLKEISNFGSSKEIRKALDRYTGGPMIFRDGFRIYPYGDPGDDWLELNKDRIRKGGKGRIVREQTAGYISLESTKAPYLVDQTNREGLVKNKSYDIFKRIVEEIFKTLGNVVSRNEKVRTFTDILDEAKESANNIESFLFNSQKQGNLINKEMYLAVMRDSEKIQEGLKQINRRERSLVEISAIGMTSMQIAHELHNFINKILSILFELQTSIPTGIKPRFELLEFNIKSLRTMISQIDEQAITMRRVKSSVDLVAQIKNISAAMEPILAKYNRKTKILVKNNVPSIVVKVNKGLIIQLFDNLILNSVYWINQIQVKSEDDFGVISIEITDDGEVLFSDNGPGISEIDADAIFEPFFTRREEGKGLGLFISKEIASFHKIRFELLREKNKWGRFNTFMIDFSSMKGD